MKRILHLCACAVTCLLIPDTALAQSIRYVDDDAPDGGNGLSRTTPYDDLQDALTEALGDPTITEIRVAGGTYLPSELTDPGDPRTATFQLQDELAIRSAYRGLAGGGDPDNGDIEAFKSTLSGELDGDDEPDLVGNDQNS